MSLFQLKTFLIKDLLKQKALVPPKGTEDKVKMCH